VKRHGSLKFPLVLVCFHQIATGSDARVCEIVNETTAIVSGATYADFLFARSILERQGWRVLRPEAPTVA
jgi:hypothetical protein